MRTPDRRGIAEDLFEIAGNAEVDEGHIEELSKRYRARFAGAQKVLQVSQIGEEILFWQNSPRSVPPRPNDARREDDEVIGIELDPLSSMGRAVGIDLATPPPGPSPYAAQPKVAPPTETVLPALERPAHTPRLSPPPASERSRAGGGDWGGPPRSSASPRAVPPEPQPEAGMWAPLKGGSSPPPPGPLDAPALGLPPGPPPAAGNGDLGGLPALDAPSRPVERTPSVRPAPGPMVLRMAGESSRPPPSSVSPGATPPAPPLAPPPVPSGLEADHVSALPPPPAAPRPISLRGIPSSLGGLRSSKNAKIALGALGAILLLALLARPGCLYGRGPVAVQGRHTSEHLGITAAFPESWQHERKLDEDQSRGEWERKASVFFRGVTVDEFIAQVTLVTIAHGDRPATEVDLRDVARTELAEAATGRRCLGYDRYGTKAVRCTAVVSRRDRRYGMIEEYFLAGRQIVFARALVEAVPGEMDTTEPAPPPPAPGSEPPTAAPTLRGYVSPIAEMDAREIESILDSIEAAPS